MMNLRGKIEYRAVLRSRLQRLSGATAALVIFGGVTRLLTLLTQIVIAREFGLSIAADAYFITENIPELFLEFIAIGFSLVFIPMFTAYRRREGEESARRFASGFFLLATAVSLLYAVGISIGATPLVRLLAPGFSAPAQELAVRLIRIMSLAILFFGLGGSLRGLLHANLEFVVPEAARVGLNCTLFLAACLLAARYGVVVLAWGIVFGALVQLLVQLWGAWRCGALELTWRVGHPGIRRAAGRMPPFILAIIGINIMFLIDRIVASRLDAGAVSALNFASRIILLPVGLVALPLRTTLYPRLARLAADKRLPEAAELLQTCLQVLLFIIVPACVGLVVLNKPVTQLLFERGAFDRAATLATGTAVTAYAIGVPAIGMIFLLNNLFLTLDMPYTLVLINGVMWVVNIGLSLLFSRYWGHMGIALSTSAATTLGMVVMILSLRFGHLPGLDGRLLAVSAGKIIAIALFMGLLLRLIGIAVPLQPVDTGLSLGLLICMFSVIGLIVYIMVGRWLRWEEWSLLQTVFREM
jgi:putative peptidoglycan lipid II flippase